MRGHIESLTAYSVLKPSKSFLEAILKIASGGNSGESLKTGL